MNLVPFPASSAIALTIPRCRDDTAWFGAPFRFPEVSNQDDKPGQGEQRSADSDHCCRHCFNHSMPLVQQPAVMFLPAMIIVPFRLKSP